MKTKENLWKCPKCGKVVDYGEWSTPSTNGTTYCKATGKEVQMVKVDAS